MIDDFFDDPDLTENASLENYQGEIVGYFDIDNTNNYANGSEADSQATFVCKDWAGRGNINGLKMTILGTAYTVQNPNPDGTGLLSINLVKA